MMKFPRTMKICNQTWTVEFCCIHEKLAELQNADIEDLVDEGEAVLGFCASPLRLICVEKNMTDSAKMEVLIHEVGHAMFSAMPHSWGTDQDEQYARMFASSVLDLCLNNKIDWIKAG